jgi:hypothetical protein
MDDIILLEEAEERARWRGLMLGVSVCLNVVLFIAWMSEDAARSQSWMRFFMLAGCIVAFLLTLLGLRRLLAQIDAAPRREEP